MMKSLSATAIRHFDSLLNLAFPLFRIAVDNTTTFVIII